MHIAHDPQVTSALLLAEVQTLTPQHLRYDAPSIICTEGSCLDKEGGIHALGAGVRPAQLRY
jgi:hypothetical protein